MLTLCRFLSGFRAIDLKLTPLSVTLLINKYELMNSLIKLGFLSNSIFEASTPCYYADCQDTQRNTYQSNVAHDISCKDIAEYIPIAFGNNPCKTFRKFLKVALPSSRTRSHPNLT